MEGLAMTKKVRSKQIKKLQVIRCFEPHLASLVAQDDLNYKHKPDAQFQFDEAKTEDWERTPAGSGSISFEDSKPPTGEIAPGPMTLLSKNTLKEACEANGHVLSKDDFEVIKSVGKGTFGTIYSATCKLNGVQYALKELKKKDVKEQELASAIYREKEILEQLDHPNIMRLEHYFMDDKACYFVFQLCKCSTLSNFLKRHKKVTKELTRFWAMEILNALVYLNEKNIVHRDLRPSNIFLDENFHIKIGGFDAAMQVDPQKIQEKINTINFYKSDSGSEVDSIDLNSDSDDTESASSDDAGKKNTSLSMDLKVFSARAQTKVAPKFYVSPEIIEGPVACFASDLWALWCIIYEWLTAASPFTGASYELEQKIKSAHYKVHKDLDTDTLNLIQSLFCVKPSDRLGASEDKPETSLEALKNHAFFDSQSFEKTHEQKPPTDSLGERFRLDLYTEFQESP